MNLAFSSLSRANVFSFALFGLGVLLRLTSALWPESFWFDEMITLYFAKLPVAESFFIDNHPPTFFLLLKLWVSLVGPLDHNSEPVLRLLPFFISVLGLAAVFGGWSSWGVRIAMVLNPASIFFASEVRHHSLFELMSILFVLQASKVWMLRGKPEVNSQYFILAIAALGLIASHFLGVVLILSFLLLFLFSSLSFEKSPKAVGASLVVIAMVSIVGWGLEHFWIRADYLSWLTEVHQGSWWLLLKEPLLVVGSYSRVWTICLLVALAVVIWRSGLQTNFYAKWTFAFFICIFITEVVFDRSLGFRKFMIPGHILMSVALGLGAVEFFKAQPRALMRSLVVIALLFGFGISVKKIGEDILGLRSGWKTVMLRECGNSTQASVRVWGHPSFDFYFPPSCMQISNELSAGEWYVSRDLAHQMKNQNGFSFDLVEVIEPKALEPIQRYRVQLKN